MFKKEDVCEYFDDEFQHYDFCPILQGHCVEVACTWYTVGFNEGDPEGCILHLLGEMLRNPIEKAFKKMYGTRKHE